MIWSDALQVAINQQTERVARLQKVSAEDLPSAQAVLAKLTALKNGLKPADERLLDDLVDAGIIRGRV